MEGWWKGDYRAWMLPILAHMIIILINQTWNISVVRWLKIEALEWIETKNESSKDSVNVPGW